MDGRLYQCGDSAFLRAAAMAELPVPLCPDLSGDTPEHIARWLVWLRNVWTIDAVTDAIDHARGVSLNNAEKRNAVTGPVRDFVHRLAEEHPLFPVLSGQPNKRFYWQELGALALRLELAGGPADLKSADLDTLYKDTTFDPNGPVATKCTTTLDFMARIARSDPGKIRTRWAFVDMYLALRVLLEEHNLEGREGEILQSHLDLESERLDGAGTLDELVVPDEYGTTDPDKIDLFNYISAFSREGATRRNVETRHGIYTKRLRRALFSESPVEDDHPDTSF